MRQPGLRPLELHESPLQEHVRAQPRRARWRTAGDGAQLGSPRRNALRSIALHAEGRNPVGQVNLAEAPHAQVFRKLVGRPGGHPYLFAQSVDGLYRGNEVVVPRDEYRGVVRAVRGIVDQVGDQTRVDALFRRVLVLGAARLRR